MTEKLDVARLKPNQYIHLLNNNTNATTLLVGPLTYTRQDHEYFTTAAPLSFVSVPPQRYCVVLNPVQRDASGGLIIDALGQAKVHLGDKEIRFAQAPFPMYPGEVLAQDVTKLQTISATQALHVMCNSDFKEVLPDGTTMERKAGDEWVLKGPLTYRPRVEVDVQATLDATIVKANQAVHLRARFNFSDKRSGKPILRKAGEEWLITEPGAFIPNANEEIVGIIQATILTSRTAIHVGAVVNFTDRFGVQRQVGDVWLVTHEQAETFIPTPQEVLVQEVKLTVVGLRQYVVVENVSLGGKNVLSRKELRRGLCSFFLHPGESLVGGIMDTYLLSENEALLLRCNQSIADAACAEKRRDAGSRWLIRGPCEYVPPVEVDVVARRSSIPLDVNEGVYIRNVRTGEVRAHIGSTVMLNEDEELWDKELDPLVEELLNAPKLTKTANSVAPRGGSVARRVKHHVVTCNVPHNALVQVYDYKGNKSRVFLGPSLVMLMPDEVFTVVSLSGGRPKQPDVIKTLCLQLGPDFMADEMVIETLDHARLQLVLSYNWEFDPDVAIPDGKAFTVPDFVGDACKAIASRIRGFVSSETFDAFHRNSSNIIKLAVFGRDPETGLLNDTMRFPVNGLVITNVDVHSVDPVDPKTREALTKSVQLAIEITTKSQEAVAIQQATALEQAAKGRLEREIIHDKSLSEIERRKLLEVEAVNAAIEATGSSKAQATAASDAICIEGQSEVDLAEKRAAAMEISVETELEVERAKHAAELDFRQALYDLEVHKTREMARIDADKFRKTIAAVGKDTIKAIARAGPEMQIKLLTGLGLQGYLVTDGTNPINLFNTAKGMTAAASAAS